MQLSHLLIFPLIILSVKTCGENRIPASPGSKKVEENSKDGTGSSSTEKNLVYLTRYTGNETTIHIAESSRGGNFNLVFNDSLRNDNGIIFSAEGKGEGWHWIREIKKDEPINLRWYGAKGLGITSYKDDSTALKNAITFIKNKGGGILYVPASTSFYGFNGDGIPLPDNIEIYGDGPRSEIKHVNPESGTYYRGVIFYTTTYGPNSALSVVREPSYPIQNAAEQQSYVVLKNSSDFSKIKSGEVIGLGTNFFSKGKGQPRYAQFELNEIIRLNSDSVFLKYPLSVPLENNTQPPVIIDASGSHTYNERLGVYDRLSKNIYIHDLKLSQADHNMITNTPYDNSKPPSNLIALGGTFESKFQNLTLEGFGTFGGNMWNRCDISNIKITSSRKLTDLGYGSANTKLHDIEWTFQNSSADTVSRSLAYINDGTHHIEIYNIKVGGNWSGNNLIQFAGGAHHIYIHDIVVDLPAYNAPSNVAISVMDEDEQVYVHDITLKNISIKLGLIKQFIRIHGNNEIATNKKIAFDNVHFEGRTAKSKGYGVYISNSPDISLQNVSIPEGDIYLSGVKSAEIKSLRAPASNLVSDDSSVGVKIKNDPSNIVKGTATGPGEGDDQQFNKVKGKKKGRKKQIF